MAEDDFSEEGHVEVTAPSGASFFVLTEQEAFTFKDVAQRYLRDNHFTNVTDLQDLDRIIIMELMCYRWGLWLARECDYWGSTIDQEKTQKAVNEYSKEIRLLKKSLGIDKSARDKDKGESIAAYIDNLRIRAREFGVKRNEEAIKAITLFKELESLMTLHNNCTPQEQRENHCTIEDIKEWLNGVAFPEFSEIDEKFRDNQKMYIRDM